MSGSTIMWTTVEVFAHRAMAEVGGSALRSAGIPHRVVADDAGGTQGLPLGASGGVELQVPTEQAEEARLLLRIGEDPAPPHTDVPTDLPGMGGAMNVIGLLTVLALVIAIILAELW